ncbi:hypothetical protein QR680_000116 [Steinernema hermaphroditum]|uniref:3-hydroxyacyl-CoA dehydrogenase NAD binding domain-containing protein n=1 Tax=Steinernema hermaphroditum TaxID=289476 RepID=A0AA39GTF2_9BILA|nr:hypothetical protein QR680_000116 [Steinernema hermaphroditum]
MNRFVVYGNGRAAQALTQLLCEKGKTVIVVSPGHREMKDAVRASFERKLENTTEFVFPDDLKYEIIAVDKLMKQINFGEKLFAVKGPCDMVFEIFDDDLSNKMSAIREAREAFPHTIIASHTESLLYRSIFEQLSQDPKLVGAHFVRPIENSKIVEVVPTKNTSVETMTTVADLARSLNVQVVTCNDQKGLIANRLIAQFLRESRDLIHNQGCTPQDFNTVFQSVFNTTATLQQMEESLGKDTLKNISTP